MCRKSRGVALIFVVLMALLIGCIVASVGVWNYIEILRSRKEDYRGKARDNALFALNLAVEKLQRLSGRDTCATAFAGSVLNLNNSKRYYTGVWDTSASTSSATPVFMGWLVSDEDAAQFDSPDKVDANNAVKVFSSGDASDVYISPVRIKDGGRGVMQYGFWICDESQKIKINLMDKYAKSSDICAKKIYHCCPQAFNVEAIFGKNNSLVNSSILSKIDFPEQLLCLDESAFEKFNGNKHAFTLHSYGVLTDSRKGGLKKDITQLAHAFPGSAEELLFERQSDLPAYVPTLGLLLSFHNLSERYSENQLPVAAMDPLFRPQIFKNYTAVTVSYPGKDLQLPTVHGIYPLLAQANISIGLATANGHFAITFVPQIAIWNPHNVDLQMANYSVELCVPCGDTNYTTSLTLQGFNDALQSYVKLGVFPLAHPDETSGMSKILKLNFATPMRAGEMRIFSLQSSQPMDIANGNLLGNADSLSNFIYLDTAIPSDGYSSAQLSCTSETGAINLHWNCFSWRLIHAQDAQLLQEIAELDPLGSEILRCERPIAADNSNCFSFLSRMKYGIPSDASGMSGVRWLANCNPRAPYVNRNACGEYSSLLGLNPAAGNWNFQANIANSTVPAKLDSAMLNYLSGLVLFDVPDDLCGVLSVGHLRHVNFLPLGYFSSQILGNSRAHPQIPLNKTFHENPNTTNVWPSRGRIESLYDYSYLLNEALFDGYFVSTGGNFSDANDAGTGQILNFFANRRFKILNGETLNGNFAAILLIDGAFNVNALNSLPWKCVLSSVKNISGETIFPRFYSEKTINQFPSLNERQIERLAEKISELIGQHSQPFFSIGNFANRVIAQKLNDCSRVGILQRAIDESKINANFERTFISSQKNLPGYDDISADGYLEENLPNVINQGDILQLASHFLCARGDTFMVRAFGDHLGNSGDVLERAYCEAIVQRVPEYVNGDANVPGDVPGKLSDVNKNFGRRYKIILFRWIGEDKI
ncbi:MAG: hypothetical protein LBI56_04295 [Puniceicoccales bacterium]|jgi:hypothetical protein|nr:hypothetical protein [Puniceicoccales bacterium]